MVESTGTEKPLNQDTTLSTGQNEPRESHLIKDVFLALGRYARGQVLIVIIMSSLYAVGFFFVEVPLWWLAGILCGPFHLVPVVGILFAAVIPVTLQLAGGGGFWDVIWVLAVIAAVQLLESLYLTPKILGRELKLHPLVIILVVLGGALLFGPLGALLAAPVVAVGLLIWRGLVKRKQDALR
jgi:predicted PurR-regulated permease PerM